MRMTPLDIQSHRFPRRWRGYDPAEVDNFVNMLAEDYESLVCEAGSLRETIRHLEARIAELSTDETLLRETLVTAQSMSEDLRRTVVKETEVLLGEAEVRAEKILDAAHRRSTKLEQNLREMKSLRSRLAGEIRAAIEAHLSLLDGLAEPASDTQVDDGKVAYLTPPVRRAEGNEGA